MIPKDGDIVDLNPLFKNALIKRKKDKIKNYNRSPQEEFGEEEDGHIHVVSVLNCSDGFMVNISTGGCYLTTLEGYSIYFDNLKDYGWDIELSPLFVQIGKINSIQVGFCSNNSHPRKEVLCGIGSNGKTFTYCEICKLEVK